MFDSYTLDTVIHNVITRDKWHTEISRVSTSVECRITEGNFVIRDDKGEQITAKGHVDFSGDYTISGKDTLTYGGVEHIILKIDRKKSWEIEKTMVYIA